jgi:hypothetical protein
MKRLIFALIYYFYVTLILFAPGNKVMVIESIGPIRLSKEQLMDIDFSNYADSIGHYESHQNWSIVNDFGYCGKYQFGMAARIESGYGNITEKDFRDNPSIWPESEQDKAFRNYTKLNEKRLNKTIKEYDGKVFRGIRITKSGILAAAHLAGYGNVIDYFWDNGDNPSDSNGSSLEQYLVKFAGYNI